MVAELLGTMTVTGKVGPTDGECHVSNCYAQAEVSVTFGWPQVPFEFVVPTCGDHWSRYLAISMRSGWPTNFD